MVTKISELTTGTANERWDAIGVSSTFSSVAIGSVPAYVYALTSDNTYLDTSVASALTIGYRNISAITRVGAVGGTPVTATGSVLGMSSSVIVVNHNQAGAEFCTRYGVMRFDQGVGFPGSGTPGRGWFTDWTVHGAVATQQQLLTGVNLVMNNYYNGQPSSMPAAGIVLQTASGIGGSLDAVHAAATTYPNGVGLAVVGTSGGGTTKGWNTGVQVGGAGGGWELATSKIGTGIEVRDTDTRGIYIHAASAGQALTIDSDAGNVMIGGTFTTDGTNYTESKMAVAKTNSAFGTGASQGNAHHTFFFSTTAFAADAGAQIGLGGQTAATPAYRAFASIAGRKTNGSSADSSGYLQFGTSKTGIGMVERMRIDADGIVQIFPNSNVGGFIELGELSAAPAVAAADKARLYIKDNGASKTQLCVIFSSGAEIVLATQV